MLIFCLKKIDMVRFIWILCLYWSAFPPVFSQIEAVTLGILSVHPKVEEEQRWQPLAAYLTRSLPGKKVQILVLGYDEMEAKLHHHELDFVLTNPGHYIQLRQSNALSGVLATLEESVDNKPMDALGGVIFTLKQRDDINQLSDLKAKRVAFTNKSSLGGYQAQAYQLMQAGIDMADDVQLRQIGMPHEAVITQVLEQKADVGFVRAGVLEILAKTGKLDLAQLKIINPQNLSSFPYLLSTQLYPQWPFVAMPQVNEELARLVTAQLLLIDHEGLITQAGGYHGFTIPADYSSVEELLRTLRLPPFDTAPLFTLQDIVQRYQYQMVILGLASAMIIFLGLLLLLKNRQLLLAKNQAKEGESKLATILDNLGAYVYIKDTHYRYLFANQLTCHFFGVSMPEIIGQVDRAFFDSETAEQINSNDRRVIENGERLEAIESNTLEKTGETRSYLSIKLPLRDSRGRIYGLCGISTDITERKKMEEELQRSNADLEQFAYAISHDMRQPLRMVASYLSLIERALTTQFDDETRQFFAFATEGAKRMDQMILSLLEFSRVGRKTDPMTTVASRAVLDEALAFLAPEITLQKAVVKVFGEWPALIASPDELSRLFQNLIGNAIKYHAEDKTPEVTIVATTTPAWWRVEVRDQGIGIDPEQFDRLFKVFSRLQARSRFEGTGVGLALCRKIVEHHGGRIGVESAGEDQGSCFWFEIPCA